MIKQKDELCVVIHIGDESVYTVIGCREEGKDTVDLLGIGKAKIETNGLGFNRNQLISAIKTSTDEVEKETNIRIGSAWVCVAEPNLISVNSWGRTSIAGEEVANHHMVEVLSNAKHKARKVLGGSYISHLISQIHWRGETRMSLSDMMDSGSHHGEISASYHLMAQSSESYNNIMGLFRNMNFAVEGIIFDVLAGAKYALTEDERQEGVLFVNLGEHTTSYALYSENILAVSGYLPIGTKHLTDTLRTNLDIPKQEALILQNRHARLTKGINDKARFWEIKTYQGATVVNVAHLHEMVKEHYDMVFDRIFGCLVEQGICANHLVRGVVLLGEGSRMNNINPYLTGRYHVSVVRQAQTNPNIKLHQRFINAEDDVYDKMNQRLNSRGSYIACGAMLYYFQDGVRYQRHVYGLEYSDTEYDKADMIDSTPLWHKLKAKLPFLNA